MSMTITMTSTRTTSSSTTTTASRGDLHMPLIPCLQSALGWHRSLILFIPASMENCMILESTDTCFNGCCILGWHWLLIHLTPASMEIFWHFNSGALGQLTLYDCRALGQHWSLTQLTPVSMDVTYLDCIGR